METQSTTSSEVCPKGIVEQLLEIAEKYDCINEIGNATCWRWKEGIITRMPKKNTVAKILKKAFNTEDPAIWLKNVSGELNVFVKNSFDLNTNSEASFNIRDIYDTLFVTSLLDLNGFKLEEIIFRLAYIRFCKNGDFKSEEFIELDENLIMELYGDWAEKKAVELIKYYNLTPNELGYYKKEGKYYFTDPNFTKFQNEIASLRLEAVGPNSHYDLWRNFFIALSDEDMIRVEKKIIEFQKGLVEEMYQMSASNHLNSGDLKTRMIRMNCATLPKKANEELKWKN